MRDVFQRPVVLLPLSTGDIILTTLLQCESKSSETSDDELDHPRRKRAECCGFCDPLALVPFMEIAFPFGCAVRLALRPANSLPN